MPKKLSGGGQIYLAQGCAFFLAVAPSFKKLLVIQRAAAAGRNVVLRDIEHRQGPETAGGLGVSALVTVEGLRHNRIDVGHLLRQIEIFLEIVSSAARRSASHLRRYRVLHARRARFIAFSPGFP